MQTNRFNQLIQHQINDAIQNPFTYPSIVEFLDDIAQAQNMFNSEIQDGDSNASMTDTQWLQYYTTIINFYVGPNQAELQSAWMQIVEHPNYFDGNIANTLSNIIGVHNLVTK